MFLRTFILAPFKTSVYSASYTPVLESLIAIALVALSSAAPLATSLFHLVILTFFFGICIALLLAMQSMVLDFVAQLFQRKAGSLNLFFWLALTLLPIVLLNPLDIVFESFRITPLFHAVSKLALVLWIVLLQLTVIRVQYQTIRRIGLCIYLIPGLVLAGFLGLTAAMASWFTLSMVSSLGGF